MGDVSRYLPLNRAYHWERQQPDRIYLSQPMGGGELKTFTWAEALDQARRMAAYLGSLGLEPGSSIAILSKNCAWFLLSDLAIWMAGHRTVAMFPTVGPDTISYVLEHSEAKLLFVGKLDTWEQQRAGVPADLPRVQYPLNPGTGDPTWDEVIADVEPVPGQPTRALDDTALLIYTSGSTGTPKGVELTFRNMAVPSMGVDESFDAGPQDRMLSYLPLAHSYERSVIVNGSLCLGFQVFFAESLETFLDDLRRARPTLFLSVPRLWLKFQLGVFSKVPEKKLARLLKIPLVRRFVGRKVLRGLGLDQVRYALSGSAPIPKELVQWYRDLGLELLEGYGMTENFAYSHLSVPGKTRVGYVGNTWPYVECKLSDQGEVLVKTDANMKGYFKDPEGTAEAFTDDGFLRTGDRGEIDAQGRLRITGRIKELFKTSKGKYIAPVPIENLLDADALVEQSCVTGTGFPQPCALVLLDETLDASDEAVRASVTRGLLSLREAVNREVAGYERLEFLAVVRDRWQIENGFLTPTLKIRRAVVEDTYGPQLEGWYAAREPVIWEA